MYVPSTSFLTYYYVYRSTPVECLHTILLGPVKYLLQELMDRLTSQEKSIIIAKLNSLNFSAVTPRISGSSICKSVIESIINLILIDYYT